MKKNKRIYYIFYLFITFYFIYTPEFFLSINVPIRSQMITYSFVGYIGIKILIHKIFNRKIHFKWNKNLSILFIGIVLSAIYFFIIAFGKGYETRFLQNTYILFQVIVILYLISRLELLGLNRNEKIVFFYNVTLIQGIIVISMLVIPQLKKVALNLYYLGTNENVFISAMRIFGISGDYTFFTPIFHGMMIIIAIYLVLFEKQKKFLFYIPFLVLSTILNGRTGLLIAVIGILLVSLWFLVSKIEKIFITTLLMVTSFLIIYFLIILVSKLSPETYNWLISSFNDVKSLLIEGDKVGTISVLSSMVIFPEGWGLLLGEGFRLYRNNNGIIHSDIGYINDLFMGGIVYTSILYSTILIYIFRFENKITVITNRILFSLILLMTIVIANYKGEASRSGLVLLGIIIMKVLIDDKSDLKERCRND